MLTATANPAFPSYEELGRGDLLDIHDTTDAPRESGHYHDTPHYKLWWAVIIDAFFVRDAAHQGSKGIRPQYERDKAWIEDGSEALLSFRWTCHQLGLDPWRVKQAYHTMPVTSWGRRKRRTRL